VLSAAESQLLDTLKRALVDLLVDVRDVTSEERGAILDLAHDLGLEADLVLSPLVLRAGMTLRPEILRDAVPL
jgi:hypothetical protein